MIYPKNINVNDQIVFVAPSFGCTIEPYITRLLASKDVLSNLGFKIVFGQNVFSETIGRSNTPEKCGEEINKAFANEDNKAVLSVGGGELMYEILPFVDFNIIRNNPKWFMGFSDNTNLTFLLPTLCDCASIYGPCAPTFGRTPWHKSTKDAMNLLNGSSYTVSGYGKWEKEAFDTDTNPLAPLNLTEDTKMITYPSKIEPFTGRLLGGCLDILTLFLGTRFDKVKDFIDKYQDDGIIWFLEACDLNPMAIRRSIFQLDLAGWFKHVKGFIIGRPLSGMEDMMGLSHIQACYEILKKYEVPIIFDVDLGHLPPSMPLITGSIAKVSYDKNITIEMKLI